MRTGSRRFRRSRERRRRAAASKYVPYLSFSLCSSPSSSCPMALCLRRDERGEGGRGRRAVNAIANRRMDLMVDVLADNECAHKTLLPSSLLFASKRSTSSHSGGMICASRSQRWPRRRHPLPLPLIARLPSSRLCGPLSSKVRYTCFYDTFSLPDR